MRRFRPLAWVLLPIGFGLGVFVLRSGMLERELASLTGSAPVYDAPAAVDTGDAEVGELAIARLTIANRGGGELVLEDIRTNCSCTGLERIDGDNFVAVSELRLGPGETVAVAVRVSVRQATNAPIRYAVRFRTSDPTQPEASIVITVPRSLLGLSVTPTDITFGSVPVGSDVREVIAVYDPRAPTRRIERIAATSNRVVARVLPDDANLATDTRRPLGRVEVVVRTDRPGSVDESIEVILTGAGRQPDPVRVSGRVSSPVEVSPPSVVLPVASGSGPIDHCTCVVRSTRGEALDIKVLAHPTFIAVDVVPSDGLAVVRQVRVRLVPAVGPDTGETAVRLTVRHGETDSVIVIPVVRGAGGGR